MRPLAALALIALLAACGADGEPVPPTRDAATPAGSGVTVSGHVDIGVAKRF